MTNDSRVSATVAIHSMAVEKRARGETVYNFAAGDPILPSHPKVVQAVEEAIRTQMILYPPVAGLPELVSLCCRWMNEQHLCTYTEKNALVTAGGKFVLFAAMLHLLKEGDEVLIPAPYWVSYPQIAKLFKATPIFLQTLENNKWKLTPQVLKQHITARSKMLILNNAGNPTGVLYTKEELQELLEMASKHGIFVISDEVYSQIVYDANAFISCGPLSDDVLVVQSCSKNFAMTGWRVGFAFGPEKLIASLTALQSHSTTGPSIVSQWAAIAAFKNQAEISRGVKDAMRERRDVFFETFNALFSCRLEKPSSALYAFIPLSIFGTSASSSAFCKEVMQKANVACVPGDAFGKEGYVRMAFCEEKKMLRQGLQALHKAVTP